MLRTLSRGGREPQSPGLVNILWKTPTPLGWPSSQPSASLLACSGYLSLFPSAHGLLWTLLFCIVLILTLPWLATAVPCTSLSHAGVQASPLQRKPQPVPQPVAKLCACMNALLPLPQVGSQADQPRERAAPCQGGAVFSPAPRSQNGPPTLRGCWGGVLGREARHAPTLLPLGRL